MSAQKPATGRDKEEPDFTHALKRPFSRFGPANAAAPGLSQPRRAGTLQRLADRQGCRVTACAQESSMG